MARQSWKHNRGPTLLCPTGTCLSWCLSSWSIWNLILLLLSLLYFLLLVNLVCAFWRWHLADSSIPLPSLEKKTGLYLFATATWGSSVCVKLVVNWHILFLVIKLASIRLCRHQEWGRRSTRESTICPGALLVMRRTAAPLDQFPQGPWLQPHVVSLYLVPLSNTPPFHPQLPRAFFTTMLHHWWPCWWHLSSFYCWRWRLFPPWLFPFPGWVPSAGPFTDSCSNNGVPGGDASGSLPSIVVTWSASRRQLALCLGYRPRPLLLGADV